MQVLRSRCCRAPSLRSMGCLPLDGYWSWALRLRSLHVSSSQFSQQTRQFLLGPPLGLPLGQLNACTAGLRLKLAGLFFGCFDDLGLGMFAPSETSLLPPPVCFLWDATERYSPYTSFARQYFDSACSCAGAAVKLLVPCITSMRPPTPAVCTPPAPSLQGSYQDGSLPDASV